MSQSEISALNLVKKNLSSMSDTEKKIGAYILEHSEQVGISDHQNAGGRCGVSEGSIINFFDRGIFGVFDLKINLAQQVGPEANYIFDNVQAEDSPKFAMKKMIDNMVSTMQTTLT